MHSDCNGLILIVEDDPDIRETLEQLLDFEGFQVKTAANGKEGIERLKEIERPCLILLDLMMPVMNGWEFLEALRQNQAHADIPVVVVTAAGAGATKGKDLQSVQVLKKPVEIETFLLTVSQHCSSPNASKD